MHSQRPQVEVAVVQTGGQRDAHGQAAQRSLAKAVRARTSIVTATGSQVLRLPQAAESPALFATPLLYWPGAAAFAPLPVAAVQRLRRFVLAGGTLLFDERGRSRDFRQAVRALLRTMLPSAPLQPLPRTHTVYRSFYLFRPEQTAAHASLQLEAVLLDGRAAVLYSAHDLGTGWQRGDQPEHPPRLPNAAERALRLGVNIVTYALCLDYKDDQVHAPFLMRRRGRQTTAP
ncbi:MAG: DUF4159 domain-containing protein [Polyangiales bacterium]